MRTQLPINGVDRLKDERCGGTSDPVLRLRFAVNEPDCMRLVVDRHQRVIRSDISRQQSNQQNNRNGYSVEGRPSTRG